jgi:hypothetical protein
MEWTQSIWWSNYKLSSWTTSKQQNVTFVPLQEESLKVSMRTTEVILLLSIKTWIWEPQLKDYTIRAGNPSPRTTWSYQKAGGGMKWYYELNV